MTEREGDRDKEEERDSGWGEERETEGGVKKGRERQQ